MSDSHNRTGQCWTNNGTCPQSHHCVGGCFEWQSYQEQRIRDLEVQLEAARKIAALATEALSYALWQHHGGGTPMHNHWSAKAQNTLAQIDGMRKEVESG